MTETEPSPLVPSPSPSTESPILSKPVPVPVPRMPRMPPVPAPRRPPTAAPRKLKKISDALILNINDDQDNIVNSEVAIDEDRENINVVEENTVLDTGTMDVAIEDSENIINVVEEDTVLDTGTIVDRENIITVNTVVETGTSEVVKPKDKSRQVPVDYKAQCKEGKWTRSNRGGEVFVSEGYSYLIEKKPRISSKTGKTTLYMIEFKTRYQKDSWVDTALLGDCKQTK